MRNVLKKVNLFDRTNRVNESSVDSYPLVSLGFHRPFHLRPKIVFQLIEFDFREHSCKAKGLGRFEVLKWPKR